MERRTERQVKEYTDIPYTIVGHSNLMPAFSVFLTAKGVKAIASQLKDDDDGVRILISERGNRIVIVGHEGEKVKE